jgi:hypothetical protein
MSDPVNPEGPPRRIVDENVVRKRSTDPRLRTGVISALPSQPPTPPVAPPRAPTPPPTSSPPVPAFLGLPGQSAPELPDFDAPTRAEAVPAAVLAARNETPARPAPPPPLVLDVGLPAPAPAPPPPPPRIAAPEARPVEPSGPVRRVAGPLDPPVEPSGPMRRAAGPLDPPVEPSGARPRPTALDPPVEPSGARRRPTGLQALDPPVEGSGARPRPSTAVDATAPATATPTAPPTPARALPRGLIAGAVGVVVLAVIAVVGGDRGGGLSLADQRRLTELWTAREAARWGGVRSDEATRAVDGVMAALAPAFADDLGTRTPRVVVVNDDIAAQAFALPDATVVVTTAALRRLGSEAQLAALLAHSLAHVVVGDVDRVLQRPEHEAPLRAALDGGAADAAIDVVTAAATATHLPAHEHEVDAVALQALREAGFAPEALGDVIRTFGVRGAKKRAAWLTQHPDDPARLAGIAAVPGGGRTGEGEYASRVLDRIGRIAASVAPTPTGNAASRGRPRTLPAPTDATAPTTTPATTPTTTPTTITP